MVRVVVVTGASAGVGRAAARLFAALGDRVALLARGEKGLSTVEDEVRARGARTLAIKVDMADYDQVAAAARRVERPVNLWEPADGAEGEDFGARGRFCDHLRGHSLQMWLSQYRKAVGTVALAAVAAGLRVVTRSGRSGA
ncbi:MAG: SDR family NAD(P)-dependent oxidoreductase [Saccharothrix sp.]|nr:SDR family NAD(P)-dependent oxidoreductase [Saccharothrix sp.]